MSPKTQHRLGTLLAAAGLALALFNVYLHVQDHAGETSSLSDTLQFVTMLVLFVGMAFLFSAKRGQKGS